MLPPLSARLTRAKCSAAWPRGDRERADTAFEFGDAFFQYRGGGVGDPRVAITFRFEVEQCGAVIGTVEGIGDGLIDRHGD